MHLNCPYCTQILELSPEVLASFAGDPHFPCPACGGRVPVPEMTTPDSAPKRKGRQSLLLPTGGAAGRPSLKASPPKVEPAASARSGAAVFLGMNRNLLILGIAVLLLLGGTGIYLAVSTKGDTHQTREERIREIIRNRYFTDLIASGKTTKKELLALWDIRPYGVGYIGLTGKTGTWDEAADLASGVGATVLRLDPPDAVARTAMLEWLGGFTGELGGETIWLLDHGEPKATAAPTVNRVTTLDRPRRVLLHWDATQTPAP
ncbi:MAG: hypothetical protein KDN18_14060 [Verrucomicrobiae bacterium]|nr:hypothetical protein [Verrucomicrobiae bacterium]